MTEERVRLRLDLAYDGGDFAGWATQPGLRTVQGVLEEALAVAGRGGGARLVVAGRTDAGVHATGQVAHVDLSPQQLAALAGRGGEVGSVARRLTGMTDPDLVVHRTVIAPEGFDARFSATFRRYRYRIADRLELQDPLQRSRTLHHPRRLDDEVIATAFADVAGLHDFAAFCKPRPGATTVRDLRSCSWTRDDGVLVVEVVADAFCHNMVRALVGAGLAVGEGRLPPRRIGELLVERTRANGFALAPAHGLTLVEVGYPPDGGLAAQAARARARRTIGPEANIR